MDELQAGVEQSFAVFPQSSVFRQPSKGSFNDPTLGHDREGVQFVASGNLYSHVLPQIIRLKSQARIRGAARFQ
jgi:hypothetical protein